MKEIMISVLAKKMPETLLSLDLHDATFNFARLDHLKETEEAMVECLNDIDYSSFWGFDLPIPLPYESASGITFGGVK